jgi:hypothetical protein
MKQLQLKEVTKSRPGIFCLEMFWEMNLFYNWIVYQLYGLTEEEIKIVEKS